MNFVHQVGAVAWAVRWQSLTTEAQVQFQANPHGMWWMEWQWDRFSADIVSVRRTHLNLQSSPLTYDKQLNPGDVTAKVILFHKSGSIRKGMFHNCFLCFKNKIVFSG